MYCPKCGEKNEEEMKFCTSCGTELIHNQPDTRQTSFSIYLKSISSTNMKQLSSTTKIACVVLIVFIGFLIIGAAASDPKRIVTAFFKNYAECNWGNVYNYLSVDESEFINKDNFIDMMNSSDLKEMDLMSYEVFDDLSYKPKLSLMSLLMGSSNSLSSDPSSRLIKNYTVNYLLHGLTSSNRLPVKLLLQENKSFFIYDKYKIGLDDIIATDCSIDAPEGSRIYIDNVLIDTTPLKGYNYYSDLYTYFLPRIFAGEYDLTVEHDLFETHRDKVYISNGGSIDLSSVTLKQTERVRIAKLTEDNFIKFINAALSNGNLGEIGLDIMNDGNSYSDINYRFENLKQSLVYTDGTGYTSITASYFHDISNRDYLDSSNSYRCSLEYIYDYVYKSKDWNTDSFYEQRSEEPINGRVEMEYTFVNGDWALKNVYFSF